MAVVMMMDNSEGSQEVYDKVRAHLGLDTPAGGIFHVQARARLAVSGSSRSGSRKWRPERFSVSASSRRCIRSVCRGRRRRSSSGLFTTA